jgi:ABC-type proline/glycine betaine transport system ATPase subunit
MSSVVIAGRALTKRYPAHLSGGEQQRVAVAQVIHHRRR